MKKLAAIAVVLAAAYFGLVDNRLFTPESERVSDAIAVPDKILASAIANRSRGVQVQADGIVTKVLPDDNDGSRHQRFIVELSTEQTLLIAHNIDIAARIASLRPGDRVAIAGEYEWNSRGGVIHWTHHDPAGRHMAGWIKHGGRIYR